MNDVFVTKSWRQDAMRIVEELFRQAPATSWNLLLDLRESLREGSDWNRTLDLFLACREELEAGQYLPFYRLRTLLASSLRLKVADVPVTPLRQLFTRKHRSLAEIRRHVARERFEHDLARSMHEAVELQVIEG